jgi:hypothetical protein
MLGHVKWLLNLKQTEISPTNFSTELHYHITQINQYF